MEKNRMPAVLSLLIVLGIFAFYAHLIESGNPADLDDVILGRIMGTLDTAFGMVLAYWIGTTSNSHVKDETITKLVTPAETLEPPKA